MSVESWLYQTGEIIIHVAGLTFKITLACNFVLFYFLAALLPIGINAKEKYGVTRVSLQKFTN